MTNLELREQVAVEVMGLETRKFRDEAYTLQERYGLEVYRPLTRPGGQTMSNTAPWKACPAYESSIQAAWEVVEAMKAKGWCFTLIYANDGPAAMFDKLDGKVYDALAPTAPETICKAALAAIRSQKCPTTKCTDEL